jgi:glycyl-tRNA synthetase
MYSLEEIVSLCKRRGFIFPTSDIYGGMANSYDYGPYGVTLLRNIKNLWWDEFVKKRDDIVGLDSQIILHPMTWIASGHVGNFSDPLVEDTVNHKRYRADHLVEAWLKKNKSKGETKKSDNEVEISVEQMNLGDITKFIDENNILSPDGNKVTNPKPFDLLFETQVGVVAGEKSKVYLRGETAQGIFANFKNICDTMRVRLPFGIAQIGKSFRNEITQGQFIFRTFEFEQAEIEYFFDPQTTSWENIMNNFKDAMMDFVIGKLGVRRDNVRWRKHDDKERSHYSVETFDLDYAYPFGFKELWGIAYRTDYDLKQHSIHSGKNLDWKDNISSRTVTPHVIEPALGLNRALFMVIADAYCVEDLGGGKKRTVLKLKPSIAPIQVAIFPLQKDEKLRKIALEIKKLTVDAGLSVEYDDGGNIGKMYRRQDEIGTPFCVTVDYQSVDDATVTIRERDTMSQSRCRISDLVRQLQINIKQI